MTRLFVSGMLRSGTSLIQTLLTNHPDALVAYQPFHQLHVDVKRLFLAERGAMRPLPLDDGLPARKIEREQFTAWLAARRFDATRAAALVASATSAKGSGMPNWHPSISPSSGSFFDIREALHRAMASHLGPVSPTVLGSKEILCEEYLPAMLDAGIHCIAVIRDPCAVIASANHGRYRDQVGDRYPLMMLLRLWRKSAAYWLRYRNHPRTFALRYEDLVTDPASVLDSITRWLGIPPAPAGLLDGPLKDHNGQPWAGNSSFGDKTGVDMASRERWRSQLTPAEQGFIRACTAPECALLGYPAANADIDSVLTFIEDLEGVRQSHLPMHTIDDKTRRFEASRLSRFQDGTIHADNDAADYFLFPEVFQSQGGGFAS
ncbi:sulfotransferase [Lysobacter sp. F6437]|uniref:sulfotransferase n=1 Tax=Lysobacter sp. F6437 TaxID=3459296 RepID=UPI00403D8CD3